MKEFTIKVKPVDHVWVINTLKNLGFEIYSQTLEDVVEKGLVGEYEYIGTGMGDYLCRHKAPHSKNFNSFEDFLKNQYAPKESEQQKKIRELEETINKAQAQIEELKKEI